MIFDRRKKEIIRLIKGGKILRALALLKEIVAKEPSNIEMRIEMARIYFKLGDLHNTRVALKECLSYRLSREAVSKILEIFQL